MGVINLWSELVNYANVCRSWNGSARSSSAAREGHDDNTEIVAELCGKVLAIDTSVWLFQCSQQSDLKEAIYDEHARVLYIVIFRIMNLLRYGVTPLFVLEGDTPEAKMGRLNQRSLARGFSSRAAGNRRGGRHDVLGRKVVELLDFMGIPHVDAPGEAEAMCAALNSVGLAHAVVTSDVDALLFGAQRVYKECRVQMDAAKLNVLECVDAGEVARRCFGLEAGGTTCVRALQAVACLCGCDYSVGGGKGVGVKTALEAVQQLTVGRPDDSQVIPELLRFLETGPDPRITALTKCTGCKTCGHEKHGRQPCPICGPGPCRPKAERSPCECEFHRSEPQRKFMRVIARAATTSSTFSSECRATIAAFESEIERAHRAAEELHKKVGGSISWSQRPDVQGVFQLMHPLLGHTSSDANKLLWTYPEVRDKMRPVLQEWDMRQGPEPSAVAVAQVEFRPGRIKQVAAKDGGLWAYIMEFDRIPTVNPADAEFDIQQLTNSKLAKSRHVRRTLVDQLWPHLLQLKEEEEQAKLTKAKKCRGKAGATDAANSSPGGISMPGGSTAGAAGPSRSRVATVSVGGSGRGGGARPAKSEGSSDVMLRFVRMGSASGAAAAAVPSTSVQQQPGLANGVQAAAAAAAPVSGRAAARQVGFANNKEKEEEEKVQLDDVSSGDAMEDELQMTQRNDGVGGGVDAAANPEMDAHVAARGQEGHPSQHGLAGLVGGRAVQATLVPLWGDTGEDGGEYDGDGNDRHDGYGRGRGTLLDDDLNDVIPTSLDELLAGASQPTRRDLDAAAGSQLQPAPKRRGGGRGDEGPTPGVNGAGGRPAASAGPYNEQPFRPEPTGTGQGLGPGRGLCAANSGDEGGYPRAAAVAIADHRDPPERSGAVDRRAHLMAVEVMDLTDSPAFVVPVARSRPIVLSTSTTSTAITDLAGRSGADEDDSGESGPGPSDAVRPDGRHLLQQQRSGLMQVNRCGGGGDSGHCMDPGGRARGVRQGREVEVGEEQGSAVKPRAPLSEQHCQQHQQGKEGEADEEQEDPGAELPPKNQSPSVRGGRLMRSLFPDQDDNCDKYPSASQAAASGPPQADRSGNVGGQLPSLQPQQSPEQDRRPSVVALSSPCKRRNTGNGGGGSYGPGGGAAVNVGDPANTAVTTNRALAAAAAAEHVDLTLDDDDHDDDDDNDVIDLT